MLKVGINKFTYKDIESDEYGWVDAKKFISQDFDLCYLKLKDKKTQNGWANGFSWDGLNIERSDEVLFWKKNKEYSTNAIG